jgi:hypothetical protein
MTGVQFNGAEFYLMVFNYLCSFHNKIDISGTIEPKSTE